MEKLIDNFPRSGSFCFGTDLLYKKENIYIMDNHRMAAWCWAKSVDENEKYTIIHIDKHYDTLGNQIKEWISSINKELKNLSLKEYDEIEYQKSEFESYKIFRWDNYIPIFHHFYSNIVSEYVFYTHRQGTLPKYLEKHITHGTVYSLLNDFYDNCVELEDKLIINLDIDYFFCNNPNYYIFISDYAIESLIENIMQLMDDKKNILTIALSPECCGGWGKSSYFIKKYFKKYGIEIN